MQQKQSSFSEFTSTLKILLLLFICGMVSCVGSSVLHEAGHARACISLGGNVGGFEHWLKDAINMAPATDCSIKPYPPLAWAGGDVASIVGWFAVALIVGLLIRCAIIKAGIWTSVIWAWWCFWYIATLLMELYHTYSPPSVWEDTTQFVHITGVNRNVVALPLAAILAISVLIWGRIQYRLVPEALTWHRLSTWLWTAPNQN